MARLSWGATGERLFETGTDRGVLYLDGQPGVPWNGLKAVSEAPDGGSPMPYYIDGYKYLNVASAEEFRATLEAFSAPREFGVCDGTVGIHTGLFATQQPRKSFGLAYRTLVGNDVRGVDHGYKIHLVYNALASPSTRGNKSVAGSIDPLALSWGITTLAPKVLGLKPTAHFVIDSTLTPPGLMRAIEDILYGSVDAEARLPEISEIIELFGTEGPLVARNEYIYPSFELPGATIVVDRNYIQDPRFTNLSNWTATSGTISVAVAGVADITVTGNLSSNFFHATPTAWFTSWLEGHKISAGYMVQNNSASTKTFRIAFWNNVSYTYGDWVTIAPGETKLVSAENVATPAGSSYMQPRLHTGGLVVGDRIKVWNPNVKKDYILGEYFNPALPYPDPDFTLAFEGAANASVLTKTAVAVKGLPGVSSTMAGVLSSDWSASGEKSLRMIPKYPARGSGYVDLFSTSTLERGETYTLLGTVRRTSDVVEYSAGGLVWVAEGGIGSVSQYSPPPQGEYDLRIKFTVLPTGWGYLRLYHGGMVGDPDVWFDKVMLAKGDYDGPWISGDIPDADGRFYHWEGLPNESPSTLHTWY